MLSVDQLKDMYYDMVLIRRFEEKVEEYSKKGFIPGFIHLSIGQEASQAGVVRALRPTDYKFPDHRGHGAIILSGTPMEKIMAELFGKATGINGGRGGSMHVSDVSVRNMGNNCIQGSITVTALGTAFASQYNGTDDVTAVFLGDGTLGRGEVHESMNLASVWKLPVIYVLINNQYAISTHCKEAHPQEELSDYARGHNMPGYTIDGNDIEAVYEATQKAAQRARAGEGPTLLELKTYRWQGHFAGDPASYRPVEEVEEWKGKCPIKKTRKDLKEMGISEEEIKALEDKALENVEEMVKYSMESPDPKPEDGIKHVYVDREVQGR